MGLAASQARLLTITARKSDAEFQSMRYSHDKIALSRKMTEISNEYQNSLNQTKLIYDFYGNGDTNTALSYGLMMTPSIMNGYMPMLTTNAGGNVVLNSQYAMAARAAGIPAEGFGCLPSEAVRNKFIQGLADAGLISQIVANNCMGVSYSQDIGLGSTDLVSMGIEEMSIQGLLDYIDSTGTTLNVGNWQGDTSGKTYPGAKYGWTGTGTGNATFSEILNGDYVIWNLSSQAGDIDGQTGMDFPGEASVDKAAAQNLQDKTFESMEAMVNWKGWDDMMDAFEDALNTTDPSVKKALEIAREKTNKLIRFGNISGTSETIEDKEANLKWSEYNTYQYYGIDKFNKDEGGLIEFYQWWQLGDNDKYKPLITSLTGSGNGFAMWMENQNAGYKPDDSVENAIISGAKNSIGYVGLRNMGGMQATEGDKGRSGLAISVSNIMRAYLTYFIEAMEGAKTNYKVSNNSVSIGSSLKADKRGNGYHYYYKQSSGSRTVNDSNLVGNDCNYTFNVVTELNVNKEHSMMSGFYDALFNQICTRGWTENQNIDDNEYLAQMYQNGKYFLTTCSDDGYYNAGNYAVNTYIREVTDNDAIAKAEAKYNTEKLKINQKEEILDLKMKNLDTEISSLTTEYDTVKSVISKQIEKSFKRYEA